VFFFDHIASAAGLAAHDGCQEACFFIFLLTLLKVIVSVNSTLLANVSVLPHTCVHVIVTLMISGKQ